MYPYINMLILIGPATVYVRCFCVGVKMFSVTIGPAIVSGEVSFWSSHMCPHCVRCTKAASGDKSCCRVRKQTHDFTGPQCLGLNLAVFALSDLHSCIIRVCKSDFMFLKLFAIIVSFELICHHAASFTFAFNCCLWVLTVVIHSFSRN